MLARNRLQRLFVGVFASGDNQSFFGRISCESLRSVDWLQLRDMSPAVALGVQLVADLLFIVTDGDLPHQRVTIGARRCVICLLIDDPLRRLRLSHNWFLRLSHLDEIILLKLIRIVLVCLLHCSSMGLLPNLARFRWKLLLMAGLDLGVGSLLTLRSGDLADCLLGRGLALYTKRLWLSILILTSGWLTRDH